MNIYYIIYNYKPLLESIFLTKIKSNSRKSLESVIVVKQRSIRFMETLDKRSFAHLLRSVMRQPAI